MVNNQAYIFIIFTLNGVLIGVLFDFFRIIRKSFKMKDFITYIEDICFWILAGIIFLYSMCRFCDGQLRFFMIIGIVMGITIYMLTISKYIIKVSVFIINSLKNTIIKIITFITFPIKIVYKLTRNIIKNRGFFGKKENNINI